MAGSLVVIETDGQENEKPVTAIKNQWQVQFARFFPYPSLPASTCTSLVPLPNNSRFRAPRGNWIATSSPAASLHIINDHSSSETIIAVRLSGKILVSFLYWFYLDCFSIKSRKQSMNSVWLIFKILRKVKFHFTSNKLAVKNMRTNPRSKKYTEC